MISVESIRQKFKTGEYLVGQLPTLLAVDYKGVVFVNPDLPNPDIIDQQERWNKHLGIKKPVKFPKLRATCIKEFSFSAVKAPTEYFESRECFDEMVIAEEDREIRSECIKLDTTSLRDAIRAMKVDMTVNMDYYRQNRSELEEDLGHTIHGNATPENDSSVENELFYRLMCQIFGEGSADDKQVVGGSDVLSYMIKDFKIISFDGNNMLATAHRVDNYLMFSFTY